MKSSRNQIKKFYKRKETFLTYEGTRFSSPGGLLVNKIEINKLLGLLLAGSRIILDLGAGTGRVSKELISKGRKVFALDTSGEMLNGLKNTKSKDLKIIKASVFSLPFESEKFDAIVSLRFFDHFEITDIGEILDESKRVLKPGGLLLFNTLSIYSLERILPDIFSKRKHANYYYSSNFLEKFFERKGFRVDKKENFFVIPRGFYLHLPFFFPQILFKIDKFLSKTIFPVFAACIFWRLKKE